MSIGKKLKDFGGWIKKNVDEYEESREIREKRQIEKLKRGIELEKLKTQKEVLKSKREKLREESKPKTPDYFKI